MSRGTFIVFDDSSDATLVGVRAWDRDNGGVLIPPSSASFPPSGSEQINEIIFRTDLNELYQWDGVTWNIIGPSTSGFVPDSRQVIAGAGLTGGGDLSGDRTFNVGANGDGSIIVNTNDVQVGILATDAQHGFRGGGNLHDDATISASGFLSAADKIKLDSLITGSVPETRTINAGVSLANGGDLTVDRTIDFDAELIQVVEASGGQAIGGSPTIIDIDTIAILREPSPASTYSYSDPNLTINEAGRYLITYNLTLDKTSGVSRQTTAAGIFVNNVLVSRTISYGRHRTVTNGEDTLTNTSILSLSATDTLNLRSQVVSGGGTIVVLGGSISGLTVMRVG